MTSAMHEVRCLIFLEDDFLGRWAFCFFRNYTVKFGVFPEHPFLEEPFWGVREHPLGCLVSTLGVLI